MTLLQFQNRAAVSDYHCILLIGSLSLLSLPAGDEDALAAGGVDVGPQHAVGAPHEVGRRRGPRRDLR